MCRNQTVEEEPCNETCSTTFQSFCPSYKEHLCCQGNGTCEEMQGPCETDSDCKGSLICGVENCDWAGGVNCCKKKCQEDGCCTRESPCQEDEGPCENGGVCMNGTTCLMEHCSWDKSKACCTNQTLDKGCSPEHKCQEGEGMCDYQKSNDCQDGLTCTANSCKWFIPDPPNKIFRAHCCNRVPGLIFSG